jgi:hypothetical protein
MRRIHLGITDYRPVFPGTGTTTPPATSTREAAGEVFIYFGKLRKQMTKTSGGKETVLR